MAHNRGKSIGGDFCGKFKNIIPRTAIREFIYINVINGRITDLSKRSIRFVMIKFNMCANDKNKVKKMINVILHRNNQILPPIKFINDNYNTTTEEKMDERQQKLPIKCENHSTYHSMQLMPYR